MNWFKNLKIAQKLISAFITVAILIGVVGFIGIHNMNKININAITMHDYNLASINNLTSIKQNLTDVRADLLKLVYQQNKDVDNNSIEKEINDLLNETNALIDTYEKSLLSKSEETTFSNLKENIKLYSSGSTEIIKSANENNYNEAEANLLKLTETRKSIATNTSQLIENNINQADDSYKENNSTYKNSSYIATFIVILGFIIAITLGLLISFMISSQVKKVLLFAEALGNNDLTKSIDVDSKDEIGNLSTALNNAKKIYKI